MAKIRDSIREILSIIDAIKTIIREKGGGRSLSEVFDDINEVFDDINFPGAPASYKRNITINPFDFLLALLQKFMTYEEIVQWLTNYIIYELPAVELAVKGVILSTLKANIDCSNDPRIPEKYRKYLNTLSPTQDIVESEDYNNSMRGFFIPATKIDFSNMLNISPMSRLGENYYFGTKKSYKLYARGMDSQIQQDFYSFASAIQYCEYNNINADRIEDCSEIDTVWELARAKDFNAFLWFVSHKAKFPMPKQIKGSVKDTLSGTSPTFGVSGHRTLDYSDNSSVLCELEGSVNIISDKYGKPFIAGNTLVQNLFDDKTEVATSTVMSLCLKTHSEKIQPKASDWEIDDGDNPLFNSGGTNIPTSDMSQVECTASMPEKYSYTFVPVSCDYRSANWYVNRSLYFSFLNPKTEPYKWQTRDYSKEFSLFNLRYIGNDTSEFGDLTCGTFNLQIMPRPFVFIPWDEDLIKVNDVIGKNRISLLPIRILFDAYGEPDRKGKYTVKAKFFEKITPLQAKAETSYYKDYGNIEIEDFEVTDELALANASIKPTVYKYYVYPISSDRPSNILYVDSQTKEYWLARKQSFALAATLHECYPGLTVYEFNYDFVMGMKLYDAETVARQLLMALANISISVGASYRKYETPYQMRIAEIVKRMIEQTTSEVADCFFTFSNEQYDAMLRQSEEKRANLYPFQDSQNKATVLDPESIMSLLDGFNDNATLEENRDVLYRALTQASAAITEEVLPEDKYSVKLNFIQNLIRILASILIEALLTPKVMLLFVINKQMMGGDDDKMSFEDILKSLMNLILNIVKELVNTIQQLQLEEVLKRISSLIGDIAESIAAEQLEFYLSQLRLFLKYCDIFGRFKGKNLETELDDVDYADIDEQIEPQKEEC